LHAACSTRKAARGQIGRTEAEAVELLGNVLAAAPFG
jgi:hypothetical protein